MEEILIKIKELYNLELQVSEKVAKGFLSENYILQNGKDLYFFKKYRSTKEEKIKTIHMAKQYFAEGGIPVIVPILHKENNTYFSIDGAYFALFPFVEGRHIDRDALTEKSIISLGEMLAKIHLRGKDFTIPIQENFSGWDKEKFIAKANQLMALIEEKRELDDFDRRALEGIAIRKELIMKNTISFEELSLSNDCLIHGDYHDGNVFFDTNDEVEYVFDFEKTGYAPRVFELVRSMLFMCFDGMLEVQKIELAKLYVLSYSNIYPISKEEIKAGLQLFYLRQLHGFWVESEHYINNNHRVDQFLISGYRSIQYLSEHIDDLVLKLTE